MDRNYFLSYGQLAFLLLLSAVGRLSTRDVSFTMGNIELQYCTDINDVYLYPQHLAAVCSQKQIELLKISNIAGYSFYYLKDTHNDSQGIYTHLLQKNTLIADGISFSPFSAKNFNALSVENERLKTDRGNHENIISISKVVRKFYMNSVKLVDGFKFIIKIPDKLTIISLK